ncbi:MAG: hypothetical protein FIA95_10885, partial [Gemmatimonadetes bacterium]|nr:hypothetical protein [Gemmatimonadota bacterium]
LAAIRELVPLLTGAEVGFAVNNNAGALFLAMAALARGRDVLVSRGQLVEIGGSFRLPDILEAAGVTLREVGTANRTRISDYEKAFDTVIEVLDPVAKRLIASTRVDAYLTNFVSPNTALGVRDDSSDVPVLELWRMELHTPQDGR